MIKGSEIRKADFPIKLLLLDRWSPRAMSGEEITEEELIRLFGAARWAPAPFNVQDWRALYVCRGTKHRPVFFELLMDGSPRLAADLLGVATSSTGAIPQLRSYRSANLVRLPLTGYVFGGPIPGSIRVAGFCPAPGPPLSKILPGIRHLLVDVQADPKIVQRPVKKIPILAKLLKERYEPVAHR
jgi:hypothetical protein